jgi:hypothetical protein
VIYHAAMSNMATLNKWTSLVALGLRASALVDVAVTTWLLNVKERTLVGKMSATACASTPAAMDSAQLARGFC